MKKFILGLALALSMAMATPALATTVPYGGNPSFLYPKVQDNMYHYGPYLGFLGNKNTKGHLFLGRQSVSFGRNQFGVAVEGNPTRNYAFELTDTQAVYHAFDVSFLTGVFYARGCIDSAYGLSCGPEFLVAL